MQNNEFAIETVVSDDTAVFALCSICFVKIKVL